MKSISKSVSKPIIALCLLAGLAGNAHASGESGEPDIITTMGQLQMFLHKLSLSVEAGNTELTDFYAHELEESIAAAETIEAYHDIPVGQLTASMLTPTFEALEQAIDEGEPDAIEARLRGVISSCNGCHQATGYGFIRIEANDANPYMQSFEPPE